LRKPHCSLKVISGEGYTGLRSRPVLARKPSSRLVLQP
jgi:hypothetical protein